MTDTQAHKHNWEWNSSEGYWACDCLLVVLPEDCDPANANVELRAENERLQALIAEAVEEPGSDYLFGLRCGLEDRDIHDRYDAVEHGWEQALQYVNSILINARAALKEPDDA